MTDYIRMYLDPRNDLDVSEVQRLIDRLEEGSYIRNGVLYWHTNDRVPPQDVCALAEHIGYDIGLAKCDRERSRQLDAFIAEYRRNQPPEPTDEERFEARAAHGPGVELVDVITGRRFTT